jgi:hypothetical protein
LEIKPNHTVQEGFLPCASRFQVIVVRGKIILRDVVDLDPQVVERQA